MAPTKQQGPKEKFLKKVQSFSDSCIKNLVRNVNSKAIPLQTWTDPEGSRRLRLTDFKIIGT
jgi:hypothetical protein